MILDLFLVYNSTQGHLERLSCKFYALELITTQKSSVSPFIYYLLYLGSLGWTEGLASPYII